MGNPSDFIHFTAKLSFLYLSIGMGITAPKICKSFILGFELWVSIFSQDFSIELCLENNC